MSDAIRNTVNALVGNPVLLGDALMQAWVAAKGSGTPSETFIRDYIADMDADDFVNITMLYTAVATIPEIVTECASFVFRHGSGFTAVVQNKDTAIEFAKTL